MGFIVDIVTGATQGIGLAIAESVAWHRSARVLEEVSQQYALILVGRDQSRGIQVARHIAQTTGLSHVISEACDLSDYAQVQQLKGRIAQQMDEDFQIGILVNNAAECPQQQEFVIRPQRQGDGTVVDTKIDKQFGSNVLGYHFMIKTFQDRFFKPEAFQKTHIVNVASNWAGGLDLEDVHFQCRGYDNDAAYRQSKQCNRMLSAFWARTLQDTVVINACHPGDPCTALSKALGYNLRASPPSAKEIDTASPIPFLCGLKGSVNVTGMWFEGSGTTPRRCSFSNMANDARRLFDLCESYCV